jgi:hypothetical protein
MILAAMESPTTLVRDRSLKVLYTKERSADFWHWENRRNASAQEVANAHGTSRRTEERWRREREHFQDCRRVRKRKVEGKGHKLGRRFRVCEEKLFYVTTQARQEIRIWRGLTQRHMGVCGRTVT